YRRYGQKLRSGVPSKMESVLDDGGHHQGGPLEEVGPLLKAMNLNPAEDIKAVILTHFHHDHTGGLDHFPHNRIIAPRASYEASKGLKGKLMGCLPQRWPIWFKPDLITPNTPSDGPFSSIFPITQLQRDPA